MSNPYAPKFYFAAAAAVLFGAWVWITFPDHAAFLMNRCRYHDDAAQQIPPLFTYAGEAQFEHDYISEYYRRAILPVGYRAVYRAAAIAWDPVVISKVLPYAALLVTMALRAAAALRIGGVLSALGTALLVLASEAFFPQMMGGLPRTFAMPIISAVILCAACRAYRLLAIIAALAATVYPSACVMAAAVLAVSMLLLRREHRQGPEGWAVGGRMAFAGMTVLLAGGLLAPQLWDSASYGRILSVADSVRYPEAGVDGRYGPGAVVWNASPDISAYAALKKTFAPGLDEPLAALLVVVLATLALSVVLEQSAKPPVRRLTAAGVGVAAAAFAAWWLQPRLYFPDRYVMFAVPCLAVVFLPAGVQQLAARWVSKSAAAALGLCAVCLLTQPAGGLFKVHLGLAAGNSPAEELYETIGALPPASIIAGFPQREVNEVPYLSRRRALLTYESHQALHEDFVLEMRRRMSAFLDAYYSPDCAALERLSTAFGVTHMLADLDDFGPQYPRYFEPFDTILTERAGSSSRSCLLRGLDRCALFSRGSLRLVTVECAAREGTARDGLVTIP